MPPDDSDRIPEDAPGAQDQDAEGEAPEAAGGAAAVGKPPAAQVQVETPAAVQPGAPVEAAAEALVEAPAAAVPGPPAQPRPPRAAPGPVPAAPMSDDRDFEDAAPDPGYRRPGKFSRTSLIVFFGFGGALLIGATIVWYLVSRQEREAEVCDVAFRENRPEDLRACWNTKTQSARRPLVIYRIAENDQLDNLDIVTAALSGTDWVLVREAANALLFLAQSPEKIVRDEIRSLKESPIKKGLAELKGVDNDYAREARALLALVLVYMEDADGLEVALREASTYGYEAFNESIIGGLANLHDEFFDGVMAVSRDADQGLMGRILSILGYVDYAGRDARADHRRKAVLDLLQKVMAAEPEPDVELKAIMCWAETGDETALARVAEYFDRAAALENAPTEAGKEAAKELALRAEQIFEKVKRRYGAEKLVDLYHLIKRNKHRKERILYYVRELHDPRQKVRDFLLELVDLYTPPEKDFAKYFGEEDTLTHAGLTYTNAVFALAELLDERAIEHLQIILDKFSSMVKITDLEANLFNAGLLILGNIAVRAGGETEDRIARYILDISDPDRYPERWTEKRAGKLRVLSFIAADMWRRFLAERPDCRDDWDPVTGLPKEGMDCPSAVDLRAEPAEPPPPPPGEAPAEAEAEGTAPAEPVVASAYEELPEMQRRRERERLFGTGEKTLDELKREEIRWVLDWERLDTKQRIYYFIKLFACPIEISMVSAMMDRNDRRVKDYERWCGDYGAATESLARLAHDASTTFRKEARQYLAERLDRTFLKYPGTQETIQYDQFMNQEIYTFVMFRQAVAKALGYLGNPEPKLLEALSAVVFDETDHPQVGRYAGTSLGIVADGPTLDNIVDTFLSPDTHHLVHAYLLNALNGHFRFAPLNDLAPDIPEAEDRAIRKLMDFAADYQGGIEALPANRLYLLGVLFGSAAKEGAVAAHLAELARGPDSRIREMALLALMCSAARDAAEPVFADVFGENVPAGDVALLRGASTLKTLRNVFTNVGTGNDPYTIPVRSGFEIEDETLFRRIDVLDALRELGEREYLDYYIMRLTLALGTDKDAYEKALAEAGLEAAEKYTPIAYRLSFMDNFTYYETPYLTWIDMLYEYALDPAKNQRYREYAVEVLWRIGERGYVYAIYDAVGSEGASASDRELRAFIYETVMKENI